MTSVPPDWNAVLEAELRSAGLRFATRRNATGRLLASFGYAEASGPELGFQAEIRNGAFRLAAALSDARLSDLTQAAIFNGRIASGRIAAIVADGRTRLRTGYPAFARRPDEAPAQRLVGELYSIGCALCADVADPWLNAAALAEDFEASYPADAGAELTQARAALTQAGQNFSVAPDGLRQSFSEPDGNAFAVHIATREDRFLIVRSIPLRAKVCAAEEINAFTVAAPLGCFLKGPADGTLLHCCALPAAYVRVDGRLMAWLIEQAAHMSAMARAG
jgi:hypothetical protein